MKGVLPGIVFAVIIISASAVVLMDGTSDQSSAENAFGLSSTKMTLAEGDHAELTFWSIPVGKTVDDVGWSSDDESIVTVTSGTVTAVSAGTATVTAKVYKDGIAYTDTCLVTVTATAVETPLTVYNPYSERYDSVILSGKGFIGDASNGGVLALTFNKGNYLIVSLAGYLDSWLYSTSMIGCPSYDFPELEMKVTNGSVTWVSIYTPSSGKQSVFETINGVTYNSSAYSPAIYLKGLGYDTYQVTFTIRYNLYVTKSVSGTFSYSEGDGRYDVTSEYTRNYVWKTDLNDDMVYETNKLCVTYSYADYWNALLRTNEGLTYYRNGIANATMDSECVGFVNTDSTVTALESHLRSLFQTKYPSFTSNQCIYAQFLFSFVQISYVYELDYTLYYDCSSAHSKGTDIWAYPDMTVYSGLGDCEDTAILLSSLFKKAGYDTMLIILPQHMMSSVALSEYNYKTYFIYDAKKYYYDYEVAGQTYYLCESTANSGIKIGYCNSDYNFDEFSHYLV